MKIGILTFQNAVNYGAILQAYALQQYISSLGNEVEVIDYRCPYLDQRRYQHKNPIKAAKSVAKLLLRKGKRLSFDEFRRERIVLTECCTKRTIKDVCDRFDAIVVGSDQVWNPVLTGYDLNYFLGFLDNDSSTLRISYAASIGPYREGYSKTNEIASLINRFDSIGMRERSSVGALANIGVTKPVVVTLDPTLLIDKSLWESLIGDEQSCEQPYVLVYSLGGTDQLLELAHEYADTKGLSIVCVTNGYVSDTTVKIVHDISPIEWLRFIANAEHVFTSSFHGMCFSLVFRKQFSFFPSKDAASNSRLTDLAAIAGCEYADMTCGNVAEIDYSVVAPRLESAKAKSRQYLIQALDQSKKREDTHSAFSKTGQSYPLAYAAKNASDSVRQESASGGMFYAAASTFIEQGGVVYGCAFDDDKNPVHIRCANFEEVRRCMKSKYSQSSLEPIYRTLLEDVKTGKPVLFTGTPCQVASVRSLTSNPDNLVTIDIICHGVPSPGVFKLYLSFLEAERKKPVRSYVHRTKDMGWRHQEKVVFGDGTEEINTRLVDTWKRLFYANNMLRPSCYHCPYTSTRRSSDITIADFWGIEKTSASNMCDDLGVSLLLLNTDKGEDLFTTMDIKTQRVDIEEGVRKNPMLLHPSSARGDRSAPWKDLYDHGFRSMVISRTYFESAPHRMLRLIKKRLLKR